MENFLQKLLNEEQTDLQAVLNQRYEQTRLIAKNEVVKIIQERLHDLPTPEVISFISKYIGCSERTVIRQIDSGTVQTQQKPGRDFAIKLAFSLNLHYYETQGLLAKTAHGLLNFSDTAQNNLRDLIIAKWLEADENALTNGTRLFNCMAELEKNGCVPL